MMKNQFRYKAWANAEMLDAIEKIDAAAHPEQWKLAVRLMNHTYVVDRIFAAHLTGTAHGYDATNTAATPTVAQLRASIVASDAWYQSFVDDIAAAALAEPVAFTFTDGDRGTMTREEMLFHVLAHGAYHRGNVGMALTACGIERPRDLFTKFLHQAEPQRRAGA